VDGISYIPGKPTHKRDEQDRVIRTGNEGCRGKAGIWKDLINAKTERDLQKGY